MISIINIQTIFSKPIRIIRKLDGSEVDIPWESTSTKSSFLITKNELDILNGWSVDQDKNDLYAIVMSRINLLKPYIQGDTYVKLGDDVLGLKDLYSIKDAINFYTYNEININPLLEASTRQSSPYIKPVRRNNSPVSRLGELRVESELKAENKLLGDENVSLQIGNIVFDENELGPDSIVFADISEISTAGTVRSDSDIAFKTSGGKAFLEVDIIFPNKESINNKFRKLLGLIKLAPIVPVGGAAVSAALINIVTATEAYKKLRDIYFTAATTNSEENKKVLEDSLRLLDPNTKLSLSAITDIYTYERESLKILQETLDIERRQKEANKQFKNSSAPDSEQIFFDQSIRQFLIPLAVESITTTVIPSAPGALRVRVTFQRVYDPYAPVGGLKFIDEKGNPTLDIRKCKALEDAINKIYLSSIFKQNNNPYFIPKIGDTTTNISSVGNHRITVSEAGHTLYKPLDLSIDKWSPILMRFATPQDPYTTLEYVPVELNVNNISWTYANKFAMIPMQGSIYPAFQYMGRSSVVGNISFSTTDRKAVQRFFTIKSSMDQHATVEGGSALFRREFCDIFNDVINLCGFVRFIISTAKMETDPDNPGLYHISLEITSSQDTFRERESLKIYESAPDKALVQRFWWWLYAGMLIQFEREKDKNNRPSNYNDKFFELLKDNRNFESLKGKGIPDASIEEISGTIFGNLSTTGKDPSHKQEELEAIWKLVFGYNDESSKPEYVEGIIESNVFIAAFLELIKSGGVNVPIQSTHKLYNRISQYGSPEEYFAKAITTSIAGGEGRETYIAFKEGKSSEAVEVNEIISNITEVIFGSTREPEGKLLEALRFAKTPWFYLDQNKLSGIQILNLIRERLSGGPPYPTYSSPMVWSFLRRNTYSPTWLPTPAMWEQLLDVILNWNSLRSQKNTSRGEDPEGYYLQMDGNDEPAFILTTHFRTLGDQLNAIVTNPRFKQVFPSFWKKKAGDITNQIEGFNLESKDLQVEINPAIFENRNNYLDLPMPRYVDIFADDRGNPLTDGNGFEIWRKVAPSYIELGQSPDIVEGVLRMTEPGSIIPRSPLLNTPRSFYDYCDPGFFYYKQSWILESYDTIQDNINEGAKSYLAPLGGQNKVDHSLSDQEKELAKFYNNNPSNIKILRTSMSLAENINQETNFKTKGTATEQIGTVEEKNVSAYISKMLISDLRQKNNSDPFVGKKHKDLEALNQLSKGTLDRIIVMDSTDREVGILVKGKRGAKKSKDIQIINLGKIDPDLKDSDFYFINTTSISIKRPIDARYMDAPGVYAYNMYKSDDAAALFRDTIEHTTDLKRNHVRAYPTFRLYFVREKIVNNTPQTYMEDDMYGYSSVISLDVVTDKNDAATAKIVVTDISGVLSSSQFASQVFKNSEDESNLEFSDEDIETKNTPAKFKLDIGTNIVLKMGYGNDPDTLDTVFTGAIAEIEPGPITTIVAQGYKAELYRHVNLYTGSGLLELAFKTLLRSSINPTSSNYLIYAILQQLASVPTLNKYDDMSGIPHFGRFMSLHDFQRLGSEDKPQFDNEFLRERDKGLNSSSGLEKILAGFLGANAVGTAIKGKFKLASSLAVAGVGSLIPGTFSSHFAKYSSSFMHTNAMRNVWWTDDPSSEGFFSILQKEWLVDTNGWEALKEVVRYRPGYVIDVLPYGNRATLFIGKPDGLYHYKPVSQLKQMRYDAAMPAVYATSFSLIYKNILSKFFASKEFGLKQVELQWQEFANYQLIFNTGLNKEINGNNLNDYVLSLDNRLLGLEHSKGDKSLTPIDINEAIPDLKDPSIWPSYHIAKYIVHYLKQFITDKPYDISQHKKQEVKISELFETNSNEKLIYYGNKKDSIIFINLDDRFRLNENFLGAANGDNKLFYSIDNIFAEVRGLPKTNLLPSQFTQEGYKPGDFWAIDIEGKLVNANLLSRVFNIDKSTGKPFGVIPTELTPARGVLVATPNSYGYGITKLSDANIIGSGVQRYITTYKTYNVNIGIGNLSTTSSPMLLIEDRSQDLNFLKSYGSDIDKLLFATFFNLVYTKDKNDSIDFLSFPNELDKVYSIYVETIMSGKGSLNELSDSQKLDRLNNYLLSNSSTIVSTLNRGGSPILYGDVLVSNETLDANLLDQAQKIFISNIKNMAIQGKISGAELTKYQERLKQFLELATSGRLASSYINSLGGVSNTLRELQRWVMGDSGVLPNKIADPTSLKNEITSKNKTGLAFGEPSQPLYNVLVQNADAFKLFLIFFAKWLKLQKKDNDLAPAKTTKAIQDLLKKTTPPGLKKFSDTHYIVSGVDIVENNIKATMSEMANNILLMTPKDITIQSSIDENSPVPVWTYDESNTSYIPYPNHQLNGVDYHPFVRPELRKQRRVIERNAETDLQRAGLLMNHMAEAIRPMYRGHLTIIGKHIKPYDKIVLVDGYKDMFGIIEVERVMHNFDSERGWTTTIIPHAWINVLDQAAQVQQTFSTAGIDLMLNILGTVDWVLDAAAVISLISTVVGGPASAGAGLGIKSLGAGIKRSVMGAIGKVLKRSAGKTAATAAASLGTLSVPTAFGIGQAAATQVTKKAVGKGFTIVHNLLSGKAVKLAGRRIAGFGAAMLGTAGIRTGIGMYMNTAADWSLKSGTLPIHAYCLTRHGRPLQAGLDMDVTSFYSWSERFGISVDNMTDKILGFISESIALDGESTSDYNLIKSIENG